MGLSIATGLPWEYFARQAESDERIPATYGAILESIRDKRNAGPAGRPARGRAPMSSAEADRRAGR